MLEESFLLVPLVPAQVMAQRVILQLRCHLGLLIVGDRETVFRCGVLKNAAEQRGVNGLESWPSDQIFKSKVYV